MAKGPVWTLDERTTLFLLKTRFQLSHEDARIIFYRLYGQALADKQRNYTAKNLEDEFVQRNGPGKPKMWKQIDKDEYTAEDETRFDQLLQDIKTAAAQQPAIVLVAKDPPYKREQPKGKKETETKETDNEDVDATAASETATLNTAVDAPDTMIPSGSSNAASIPPTLPPGALGQPLGMIHARSLSAQDSSGKYIITSWDTVRFVTKDSKLCQCGGPVASIIVDGAAPCDVMLCYKDICGYCTYLEAGDEAHQAAHALAADNGVEGDPAESLYKGLPFFHIIGNTKKGEKARQFDANKTTDWSVPSTTFNFQAWFDDRGLPDGQLAQRRCLICQADACRVCSGDEKVDKWENDRAPGGAVYEKRQKQWAKDRAARETREGGRS